MGSTESLFFSAFGVDVYFLVYMKILWEMRALLLYFCSSISPATRWIKYISQFFYANEIMQTIQWGDVEHIPCPPEAHVCLNNGEEVMQSAGLSQVIDA